jgi:N-acetylglucosamine kinase-like BadF-type ATPase
VKSKADSFLGLDIGGSSSRARLVEHGSIVAEADGPGANVAVLPRHTVEGRLGTLLDAIGPMRPDVCCAGSAGAEVPAGRERLEHLLAELLPGCRIVVVHDARLVLAAAGLESGIALVSGTGSVAYGRDPQGREARAGGWGWLIGDDGSAAWLAREAAREVMRRSDAGNPIGRLGDAMLGATKSLDTTGLIGNLHGLNEPREWAELAGLVFEAANDDPGAAMLVERAADALAALVDSVRKKLSLDGPVVLAGGQLLNQTRLEAEVRRRVGPAIRLEEPPVAGAVRLAELSPG